jgi:hypothetical protein
MTESELMLQEIHNAAHPTILVVAQPYLKEPGKDRRYPHVLGAMVSPGIAPGFFSDRCTKDLGHHESMEGL